MADSIQIISEDINITFYNEDGSVQGSPSGDKYIQLFSEGPQGPQGPPGVGGYFELINQSSPAATWILAHGKGKLPIVQVFLNSGEMVITDVLITTTQINVTFPTATSGFVIVS